MLVPTRTLFLVLACVALASSEVHADIGVPADEAVVPEDLIEQSEQPLMVIMGTRHGARYPTKALPWPRQLEWPAATSGFWKLNAGLLTPQGAGMCHAVGQAVGKRYGSLLLDQSNLVVFADDSSRTIASAQALLHGATGKYLNTHIADLTEDTNGFEAWTQKARDHPVTINLITLLNDPAHHGVPGFKDPVTGADINLKLWEKEQYKLWSQTHTLPQDVVDVVDLLTPLTQQNGQLPDVPLTAPQKFVALHEFSGQVVVNAALGMPSIANDAGIPELTPAQVAALFKGTDQQYAPTCFQGASTESNAPNAGRLMAGYGGIISEAINRVQSKDYSSAPKFVLFSSHDGNLLQLFALLGLVAPSWPAFAAFYIFEIYKDHVKFCMNWDTVDNPNAQSCFGIGKPIGEWDSTKVAHLSQFENDASVDQEWMQSQLTRFASELVPSEKAQMERVMDTIFS